MSRNKGPLCVCSLQHPKHPESCQAPSRHSVNVFWIPGPCRTPSSRDFYHILENLLAGRNFFLIKIFIIVIPFPLPVHLRLLWNKTHYASKSDRAEAPGKVRGGSSSGCFFPFSLLCFLMWLVHLGQPEAHWVQVSRVPSPPRVNLRESLLSAREEYAMFLQRSFSSHWYSGWKEKGRVERQEEREERSEVHFLWFGCRITVTGEIRSVVFLECDVSFSLKIMSGFHSFVQQQCGVPVVVLTGLKGMWAWDWSQISFQSLLILQKGHYQGALGVTQWLRASVLNFWICGFLGSGMACWE